MNKRLISRYRMNLLPDSTHWDCLFDLQLVHTVKDKDPRAVQDYMTKRVVRDYIIPVNPTHYLFGAITGHWVKELLKLYPSIRVYEILVRIKLGYGDRFTLDFLDVAHSLCRFHDRFRCLGRNRPSGIGDQGQSRHL